MMVTRASRLLAVAIAMLALVACGTTPTASVRTTPSPSATASSSAAASPSATPTVANIDPRLVIEDFSAMEVRLARLDATDTATVKGQFDGIVGGKAIVVNRRLVQALSRTGATTKLGTLAGDPNWGGPGTVAVKPDLSQWVYTLTDDQWNSHIHLGSAATDSVIATVPSPDGNAFYQAFAWNASGVYMSREATGLGGAGPFLEYHFPLARLDLATGKVTAVSPECVAETVLDDGTMICRQRDTGSAEVRRPSGKSTVIHLATGSSSNANVYSRLFVSPDGGRLLAARNGAANTATTINYQMGVADLTGTSARAFGPLDYIPDTWLPDGRVVADHLCLPPEWAGGACDGNADGTYIFSADGASHSLFYKLRNAALVRAYI